MQWHHTFSEFVWSLEKVCKNKGHQTKWSCLCWVFQLHYHLCRCTSTVGNCLLRHILFLVCWKKCWCCSFVGVINPDSFSLFVLSWVNFIFWKFAFFYFFFNWLVLERVSLFPFISINFENMFVYTESTSKHHSCSRSACIIEFNLLHEFAKLFCLDLWHQTFSGCTVLRTYKSQYKSKKGKSGLHSNTMAAVIFIIFTSALFGIFIYAVILTCIFL